MTLLSGDGIQQADLRRRWYEAHSGRFERDGAARASAIEAERMFEANAAEAMTIRDDLARSDGSDQLARLLAEALTPPSDDIDASRKLTVIAEQVSDLELEPAAQPARGYSTSLLSYFWALEDRGRWPVMWSSAASFVEHIAGRPLPTPPGERYLQFLQLCRNLDDDFTRLARVAAWWSATKPVFLDPVLVDRCAYGRRAGDQGDNGLVDSALVDNAFALTSVSRHIGTALANEVSAAAGRQLVPADPALNGGTDRPRPDLRIDWRSPAEPGIRVLVNHQDASIGLTTGVVRSGWLAEAIPVLEAAGRFDSEVLRTMEIRTPGIGHLSGGESELTYARRFDRDEFAALDLRAEVITTTKALRPLLDELVDLASGKRAWKVTDRLRPLVGEFRRSGYPTPLDERHRADRAAFARLLAAENVGVADVADLNRIWSTDRYGSLGPQPVLTTWLRQASAADYDGAIEAIGRLCWGDDDDADRIDELLGDGTAVNGLGEETILKLLAICHPTRYVPVFPYSGPRGKRRMLQLLGLPETAASTRGRLQVETNDRIRLRLDQFFPGDPWGMARFLHWYAGREANPAGAGAVSVDLLDAAADDLLVDRAFLDDIVALLEDKGQVILYGPPGTGKTYLARRLADALVTDPSRRSLVQFHPSTSYEDFFEGYRPETSPSGEMSYRLTPGPLALLAEQAGNAPGHRHVMIIDEINRANLPKVLGELLFLLEYRDEKVRTLYRPDDAFELPKDLWFIGTMNTADRSVALVDAALRRRFHFVPFFPNHGPIRGLLDRWLAANGEPAWIGELVSSVNDELSDALGGPHLQLGSSHFMKRGLDHDELRRIWEYNIEPFIEDQFFGDLEQIDRFRFTEVLDRHRSVAGGEIMPALGAGESIGEHNGLDGPQV